MRVPQMAVSGNGQRGVWFTWATSDDSAATTRIGCRTNARNAAMIHVAPVTRCDTDDDVTIVIGAARDVMPRDINGTASSLLAGAPAREKRLLIKHERTGTIANAARSIQDAVRVGRACGPRTGGARDGG